MTAAWPRLVVAQLTDPGREPSKQENEDSVVYQELHVGHLLLVCDGMGGHSSGREASQLAVQTIVNELARTPPGSDPGEALRASIEEANRRVYALGGTSTHGRPGSTCVAALIHPLGVEVAHLGDSRAYLLRAGQLWPLTRDHSMVQEMVNSGLLRPEEAIGHPDGNKITRALGMGAEAQVELRQERLLQQPGDIYLLVSDGVTDVVRDSDLQAMATVSAEGAQMNQLCAQVVQLALARGGPDNTTILAVSIADPGLRPDAAQQPPRRTFAAAHTIVETLDSAAPQFAAPYPGATLPGAPAPALAGPAHGAPAHGAPAHGAPAHGAPAHGAPAHGATPPAHGAPGSAQAPAGLAAGRPPLATPLPTSGRTVPLPAHGALPEGGPARTIIDVDEPTPSMVPPPPMARGVRVAIGSTMALGGAVLLLLSLRSLLPADEAPPPLDSPEPSAAAPPPPPASVPAMPPPPPASGSAAPGLRPGPVPGPADGSQPPRSR